MLTVGSVDWPLYPNTPKSLKSQWVFYASQLSDPIEVIEIDGTFLLSLGAHTPHENYLFATKHKPTTWAKLLLRLDRRKQKSFCRRSSPRSICSSNPAPARINRTSRTGRST